MRGATHIQSAGVRLTGLCVACLAMATSSYAAPDIQLASLPLPGGPYDRAAIIPVFGEINQITLDSIERRLARVQASSIPLVVFEMDTPGGALDATLKICQRIKSLRDHGVMTAAWIHHEAYSAGTIIALATDGIIMASNATIGDCQPITISGDTAAPIPEGLEAKAISPLLAELRDSARRNGYDMELVMGLIRPDTQVYWVENVATGQRRFVNAEERDQLFKSTTTAPSSASGHDESKPVWRYLEKVSGIGQVPQPFKNQRELLTLRTNEASAIGWSKETVNSDAELKDYFRVSGSIERMDRTAWETVVTWLASPMVRGVLFILIVLGAYSEFHAPGMSIPAAIALLALVLYLGAPYLAGLAVTWEILAVLLGMILLGLELFVIPGFGVAGIAGLLLIGLGFIASFVPPEPGDSPWSPHWPQLVGSYAYLGRGLWSLACGAAGSVLGMVVLARLLPRVPMASRLVSKNPTRDEVVPDDPHEGLARVGDIGVAESLLRPAGKARFGATLLDVVSEGEYIPRSIRVEVVQREGGRIVVRRID